MRVILKYFIQGLIIILPIAVTAWIIVTIIQYFDGMLKDVLPWHFPGLGILLVFGIIVLTGFIASVFISKSVETWFEGLIQKTPFVKVIYFSVKDIVSAMVDKEKRFDRPVVVKLRDDMELYQLGFITQEDISDLGFGKEMVFVYLPHSYAVSGLHCLVPRKNVRVLDQSSSEVMKFIMSAGLAKIDRSRKKLKNQVTENQKSSESTSKS